MTTMRAAVFHTPAGRGGQILSIEDVPLPQPGPDESLLKVLACGVCRTDLHIVEGDLPVRRSPLILGHQIVGEVVTSSSTRFSPGDRVGVSWMGGTDGTCQFCESGRENLCDAAEFTGYTRDGGYAQYTVARTGFLIPLGQALSPIVAAPLLCAGMIGFRSLRVAAVKPGHRVGLFGFGASARLILPVLQSWNCDVYVATRGARHQQEAAAMGARWVGDAFDLPPSRLDAAITFAPVGSVVLAALKSLDKGGIVAINAIHLDQMPSFDYDSLLWGERQIRSVANMTRQDAKDYLQIAGEIGITPATKVFPLDQANDALQAIRDEDVVGSAVIVPKESLRGLSHQPGSLSPQPLLDPPFAMPAGVPAPEPAASAHGVLLQAHVILDRNRKPYFQNAGSAPCATSKANGTERRPGRCWAHRISSPSSPSRCVRPPECCSTPTRTS